MDIISLFQTVLFALLAIGILVTVHEYGHYIVARKLGIKVLRFSIGFGKPIWRRTAGDDQTEYVVSRWPLGGYVKMLDSRDCDVPAEESHRAFNHQPVFNRILVLLAGPAFNFILAIAFFWVVFMLGVDGMKPIVGDVRDGSPAAIAGITNDDIIVAVNGSDVSTWSDAHMALLDGVIGGPTLNLSVRSKDSRRDRAVTLTDLGNRKALTEPRALLSGLGLSPWSPTTIALVAEVLDDAPAQRAGLMADDQIISIDGVATPTRQAAFREIHAHPDEAISMTIVRNEQEQELLVKLSSIAVDGKMIGRLGAEFRGARSDRIFRIAGRRGFRDVGSDDRGSGERMAQCL